MATSSTQRPLAVVTGASSGIGYELARQFAQHGYDLVVCAEDIGIQAAARAFEADGARVYPVQIDLRTAEGVERLYDEIRSTGVPVSAIALNAGVGVNGDFTRETDLREELAMIQLNVVSTVHLTKLVARDMVARGQGKIRRTSPSRPSKRSWPARTVWSPRRRSRPSCRAWPHVSSRNRSRPSSIVRWRSTAPARSRAPLRCSGGLARHP